MGFHGPQMAAAALCASAGSFISELFPFGLEPGCCPFANATVRARGGDVFYSAWHSADPSASTASPHRSPEQGGIAHFHPDSQRNIKYRIHLGEPGHFNTLLGDQRLVL